VGLEYRSPAEGELRAVLLATHTAFGEELKEEDFVRVRQLLELDRALAAWDDGRPVGVTASWPFELTIPGGHAPVAGVTLVGVLPSHRRRGILRELMTRQLADVRQRGEPLAILWASESPIYGRFGYGLAAPSIVMDAERPAFALRDDPGPRGSIRLVEADEALERFPPLYEQVRADRVGLLSRTADWWRLERFADPEHWRHGAGPLTHALLEMDGEPAGYALYRVAPKWERGTPKGAVQVDEAFGTSPEAFAEISRFLFGVDLVDRVEWRRVDPALFLMVADPRRLHLSVADGLWLRLVDLAAALRARGFGAGERVVLDVSDALLPGNVARWSLADGTIERVDEDADVALDVADLAAAYLGAFTFERLAAAGRARELRPGGLARATALFATPLPPFCPEGF
jgi:predicted acetyltransferase